MKSNFFGVAFFLFLLVISCKKNEVKNSEKPVQKVEAENQINEYYLYARDKDTIQLFLGVIDNKLTGKLNYLPFEKDARIGTLELIEMKGDTLYAIYNSTQEGQNTSCEIALLKNEGNYILTNAIYGGSNYEFNSDYSKGYFKNKSQIKFDGDILQKVARNSPK